MSQLLYFGRVQVLPVFDAIPVPLGLGCLRCDQPFLEHDKGFVMPWETHDDGLACCAFHLKCFTDWVLGAGAFEDINRLHNEAMCSFLARRIANEIGVSMILLTGAIRFAPSLEEGLAPFTRILELLRGLHGDQSLTREWLNTPHRELDDRAPIDVMLQGHAEIVRDMLEAARLGLPT